VISRLSINSRLKKLQENVKQLKIYRKSSLADVRDDFTLQAAVLHTFQLSIECVLDIGEFIISENNFRKPENASEVIVVLGEQAILPKDFALRFSAAAKFRNLIVHEYIKIDVRKVYQHLQKDLEDFDFYTKCIAKFLEKNKNSK